ncbi:hypothetical protein [Roseibium sediminicola]|uniref:Uncharacterized protein n=1 Tax=Roseibium sediminicola TaxID=2933272 RepID=A0ABT0GXS1_9HYPH|nr:hypothetical protein [Roseibium sp. CAU 1639]MCK7614244.1 hypothetical protein [Roseibium sp. CAU 1639]
MLHTHDKYEQRARALRHQELRALARALSGLVQSPFKGRGPAGKDPFAGLAPVNDRDEAHHRAA